MRILIVNDDVVDRMVVKRALKLGGGHYDLVEAETVETGLEAFQQQQFDLVLIDYKVTGRDGVEMLMHLRDNANGPGVAIVMTSDSEDEQVAMECIQSGAQDYVLKSELSGARLRRAILNAQVRFDLERQLQQSFEKVKQLAERDSLTGLANRYLFDETLKISLANTRRGEYKFALLIIDLDNFKYVNDSFGHDVGDCLLKRVADRIRSCLRGHELFARLGGDEFAIALSNLNSETDAVLVAQRIIRVLEKSFEINEYSFSTGASIGISIYPDNALAADELFKQADIALYRAKKQGKNQSCFFEMKMQEQFMGRLNIEKQLRAAIVDEDFLVKFQPVYHAQDHELGGFESFLYWKNEQGIQGPKEFISIAEETKLMIELGRWALRYATWQVKLWQKKTGKRLSLSINLCPLEIADNSLVRIIEEQLSSVQLDPGAVCFEFTERALSTNYDDTLSLMRELNKLGCKIVLDDFGVGSISIAHLRDLPIDMVKIDPQFLPADTASERDYDLFRNVIRLIQSLGHDVVVVGTETPKQVTLCCELNVNQLQGHFFARPEPADYIEQNLLHRSPPAS